MTAEAYDVPGKTIRRGAFFGHLELWLGPPEPDAWITERIVFPILVVLNIIALLALIGTLKLPAKTST
jgi:hypothetical protein